MEKGKSSKVIAIVALCVAVVGLSLGFAAFSSNLVIKSSASVTANATDFKVVFSNAATGTEEGGATPGTPTVTSESLTLSTGTQATASVISTLTAGFSKPGQSVTYTFRASNTGKYKAYLNGVTFAAAAGADDFKDCTPSTGSTANQGLVDSACEDINLTLKIGNTEYTATTAGSAISTDDEIEIGQYSIVTVTIEYAAKYADDGQTLTNTLADGAFDVKFGNIELEYGSVEEN